jgi:hypothetical protein
MWNALNGSGRRRWYPERQEKHIGGVIDEK